LKTNEKQPAARQQRRRAYALGDTRRAFDENSHPHTNGDATISVVHNGIIENYVALKNELIEKGYVFKSQTDTEVIAHLIDFCYKGDIYDAVINAAKRLKGAYALSSSVRTNRNG
jgi:glucosamine 6-phosphate synthetase-like amidotransferase/phosphosugar isomerase protein